MTTSTFNASAFTFANNVVAAKTVAPAETNTNTNNTVKENTVKTPTASEIAADKSISVKIGRIIGKVEVNTVHHVARAAGYGLTRTGSIVERIGQAMQASGEVCYAYADTHKPGLTVEHKVETIAMFPELAKKYNDPKLSQNAKDMIAQLANVRYARLQDKIKAAAEAMAEAAK